MSNVRRRKLRTRMFKHHKYFPKARQAQSYFFPFVCFSCRKSFKKPSSPSVRSCPECGGAMTQLSRKFKAPKRSDTTQWKKVQFLVDHGFRFYSVFDRTNCGQRVAYPKTLEEAREFVKRHKGQVGLAAPRGEQSGKAEHASSDA
jgi:predicted RNA-binding Zn-ribbon protein involved in translation (DUF1610 family)